MMGFGVLEWTFLVVLVVLVAAAGLFALFLVTQQFRGHSRRRPLPCPLPRRRLSGSEAPVPAVTVSRQYGAGGLRVARALADALGFRLVDREIVEEAARRIGVDPEVAAGRDERVPAIVEELGMTLAAASPPFGVAPPPPMAHSLDDRALAEATGLVIVSLAEAGDYVILGRGGQAALARRSDACHLSLVGELRDRARRIARWQEVDEKTAADRCRRVDADRAAYVRRYYGVDIRDPLLYDCVLNTSSLGLDAALDAAVAVARRKLGPG